jgi:hypothetical protein
MLMFFCCKKSDFVAISSQEGVSVALFYSQSLCPRLPVSAREALGSYDVHGINRNGPRRVGRHAGRETFA